MTVEAPERTQEEFFPAHDEYLGLLTKRTRRAFAAQMGFLLMLTIAVLGLAILLYTIIDDSFGNVAVVNQVQPEEIVASIGLDPGEVALGDLDKDQLVQALQVNLNRNVGRRLEREQRFYEDRLVFETQEIWDEVCASGGAPSGCSSSPRSGASVARLVQEQVVQPDIIDVNGLTSSLLDPEAFEQKVERAFAENPEFFGDYTFDQVRFEWRAWFSWSFITSPASATPEVAGIRTAILGSIWLVAITVLFAVPVGVGRIAVGIEFNKRVVARTGGCPARFL